jgi:polyhydroxybutyrate depolymerase
MRALARWAAVGVAVASLASCRLQDGASPVEAGTSTGAVTVAGVQRSYRLYVPVDLAPGPAPLVVMLHGGFGSAKQAQESYGWDAEASLGGFLVLYPDGAGRAWSVGGGCCGESGRTGVDDVAVVEAMIEQVAQRVPVDDARVFATGMSNGAMMAYRLACDTDRFVAIAPVAGTLMGDCPDPAPTSVLHIHGLADENVPYDGSPGSGLAAIDGAPVADVVALWERVGGCDPPSRTTVGPVTRSTAACPDGRAVELITIDGAGHQWPGASVRRPFADRPAGVDATATIWRFFASHARPA